MIEYRYQRPPKGHKLVRSWSGVQSNYANGRCECGQWSYRSWTTSMRRVIRSHQQHITQILEARKK